MNRHSLLLPISVSLSFKIKEEVLGEKKEWEQEDSVCGQEAGSTVGCVCCLGLYGWRGTGLWDNLSQGHNMQNL